MKKFSTLIRKVGLAAAAMTLSTFGTTSQATIISSLNTPYNFLWSYNSGAGLLTGNGYMTVTGGFGTSQLSLQIGLTNTSALSSNRLTSFGFGIDPNATSVTLIDSNDGGLRGATLNNIPSLATIEVCVWGGQNCSGGSNGGIFGQGGTDIFALNLGGTWGNSINIDPVGFKYQTGVGSYEFTTTPTITTVPEPGTLALLGLGLAGLGFIRRRRA